MTLTQIELILLTPCFFLSAFQQAAFHPEVSEELRSKALQYSSECTTGYISLLEQVLQVRAGQAGAFLFNEEIQTNPVIFSSSAV